MRLLRGLIGTLLWIVGALLGLVGILLCLTIVLLPVGVPLVAFAGRLLTRAGSLLLPRAVVHPVAEASKTVKRKQHKAISATSDVGADVRKKTRDSIRKARKRVA
ncbi:hypothetical protein AU193_09930 [Mycobacterium sp. GA-1285]|uniref:hypothetical protein n=1 Tax=Mycobacterium sp. GA-1285 TaxID=1772282 RepID=UPI00074A0222|nr:hypothetical protein [Mycobacterium sp. GA-1285]KUI22931.1 hypothetical protein AU193_09930 [Mycobacterium sp. GA-1285]